MFLTATAKDITNRRSVTMPLECVGVSINTGWSLPIRVLTQNLIVVSRAETKTQQNINKTVSFS